VERPSQAERLDQILSGPSFDRKQIEIRLSTAAHLLDQGLTDIALLVAWSMAEAVFRQLAYDKKVPLNNTKSSYLIKLFYSNGILGWRDYELLNKVFVLRNQIAHGFPVKKLDSKTIKRFLKLITRLATLQESEPKQHAGQ
jgi:hypothetical protein